NELVVARLATALGAPCPSGMIVDIPDAVLQDAKKENPNLGGAVAGLGFGCHWYDVSYAPGVDVCRAARNRNDLIILIGLYTWARNSDFKPEHLLYRTLSDGSTDVMGFDHGHCFGSPTWDATLEQQANVGHSLPNS